MEHLLKNEIIQNFKKLIQGLIESCVLLETTGYQKVQVQNSDTVKLDGVAALNDIQSLVIQPRSGDPNGLTQP